MRFTCLTYDPKERLSIYATDSGEIVKVSDEDLHAHYEMYTSPGPRATVLPPGTRYVKYFQAGRKLMDLPSQPAWYYDPSQITIQDLPLKEYEVAGWHFYALWLAAWGKEEWVFADPYKDDGTRAVRP